MATRPKEGEDQTGEKLEVNTARLETLADAAAGIAQARRWQSRKNGLSDEVESSEVRRLSDDAAARAAAEESMQKLLAKKGGALPPSKWKKRS
jgi:hypothetical protein